MVQQIKLKSGMHSIRFGNQALMEFEAETGRNFFNGEMDDLKIKEVATLCHCGLKDAAKLENKEFTMTFDDVVEELNEPGALPAVMALFGKAMPSLLGKVEETTGKKQEQQAKK